MPWDMSLWNLVQENKAAVIRNLLRQFDPSSVIRILIYDLDGHWSKERFKDWLGRSGITCLAT